MPQPKSINSVTIQGELFKPWLAVHRAPTTRASLIRRVFVIVVVLQAAFSAQAEEDQLRWARLRKLKFWWILQGSHEERPAVKPTLLTMASTDSTPDTATTDGDKQTASPPSPVSVMETLHAKLEVFSLPKARAKELEDTVMSGVTLGIILSAWDARKASREPPWILEEYGSEDAKKHHDVQGTRRADPACVVGSWGEAGRVVGGLDGHDGDQYDDGHSVGGESRSRGRLQVDE